MLLTAALLAAAQAGAAPTAPDYSNPAHWLCLPGRTDVCTTPLKTTALNPNGYGSTGQSPVAKDAGIDCFYVYPTISRDRGVNSDLTPGDGEEKAAVVTQFARFAGTCRTFAPIYRSMTVGLITAVAAGADFKAADGDRLWRCPRGLEGISGQAQQGTAVRPHRPQPGLVDAPDADRQ